MKDDYETVKSKINSAHNISDLNTRSAVLITGARLLSKKSYYEESNQLCDEIKDLYKKTKNDSQLARVFNIEAANYYFLGKPDSSLSSLDSSIRYYNKVGDHVMEVATCQNKAIIYQEQGMQRKALELLMALINHSNDSIRKITNEDLAISSNIGTSYLILKDYDKAEFYFNKGLKIAKQNNDLYSVCVAYINISDILTTKGDYKGAIDSLDKALLISKSRGLKLEELNILKNKSSLLIQMDSLTKGIEVLNRCLLIAREINVNKTILSILLKYVEIYNEYGDQIERILLKQSLNFSIQNIINEIIQRYPSIDQYDNQEINKALYQYYNKKKNYKKAIYYNDLYQELRDTLFNQNLAKEIANLEFKYKIEQKELEAKLLKQNINALEKEKELIKQISILWIIIILFVLVTILLYINRKRIQIKKEKLVAQKELDLKRHELQIYIQQLKEKNQMIEDLENRYQEIDIPEQKLKIQELSKLKILTDSDWENFQRLFSDVYPNFIYKIENVFPILTEGEKRLFILIKLGFSNKQNAGILGISPDSIKKNKYRLKKKLGLSIDEDLSQYVLQFY